MRTPGRGGLPLTASHKCQLCCSIPARKVKSAEKRGRVGEGELFINKQEGSVK